MVALFASTNRKALLSLALLVSKQPRSISAFTKPALFHSSAPVVRSFSSSSSSSSSSNLKMTKKVLVPIAEGSEEIETTCITDTLTRFGAEVTVASVMEGGELLCKMSRGIKVMADITIDEAAKQEWDLVALPGGVGGAKNLRASKTLSSILEKHRSASKLCGAVCASPALVLAPQGLIGDAEAATCFPNPDFRKELKMASDDKVVVTGNLITSQGPGTSILFALELGEKLFGKEKRDEIQKQMLAD